MIQDAHIHQGDCLEIMKTSDDGVPCKPIGIGLREVDKYGRALV